MGMEHKVLGKFLFFNPKTDVVSIKLNLLSLEQREAFEKLTQQQQEITLQFSEPFEKPKTYPQLKRYYGIIKAILLKKDIEPSSTNMSVIDDDTKRRALPSDFVELDGKRLPVPPPSKAKMSTEQLKTLIEWLQTTYSYLNIKWDSKDWYE